MNNCIKKKERDFTQVSNSFLRDERLSFKAKGLFCYMFSMSDGWNFTIRSIAKQQKDGEASVKSALDELKEFGYIKYEKHQDGSGTYYLDDEPKLENPKLENPNMENPKMGKSQRIKNTNSSKNKNTIADEIYEHYKTHLKSSKKRQSCINNITRWLKEYDKDLLVKAINNYREVVMLQMLEDKYIKECSNFFGVKDESKGYFIDFIDYKSDELNHKPKNEHLDGWSV